MHRQDLEDRQSVETLDQEESGAYYCSRMEKERDFLLPVLMGTSMIAMICSILALVFLRL